MLIIYLDIPTKRFHDTDNTIESLDKACWRKCRKSNFLIFLGSLADECNMAFGPWDAVMQHKECCHMALVNTRCNQVNEDSLPSKPA